MRPSESMIEVCPKISGGALLVGRNENDSEAGSKEKWSYNAMPDPSGFSPPKINTTPELAVALECRKRGGGG